MLSRCSSEIATALTNHYSIPKQRYYGLSFTSEVDIRHAEEGVTVIQDYLNFIRFPIRYSTRSRISLSAITSSCATTSAGLQTTHAK